MSQSGIMAVTVISAGFGPKLVGAKRMGTGRESAAPITNG
jgi:hypothetical protein